MTETAIAITGRQPELSIAELESVLGAGGIRPMEGAAILAGRPDGARLGGSRKLADAVGRFASEKQLIGGMEDYVESNPDLRFIGVSAYGCGERPFVRALSRLKKSLRHEGRSLRIVKPTEGTELSAAQVLHNKLLKARGADLVVLKDGDQYLLGRTYWVPDLYAYTRRDRERPRRDTKVGMLPPRLAQMLINFAVGAADPAGMRLLDPFCGTGVLLQEAALLGMAPYGTDVDKRMIEYSRANLEWLQDALRTGPFEYELEQGDARTHRWQPPIDAVAAETYLGPPLMQLPPLPELEKIIRELDLLHRQSLENLAGQLPPGTPVALGVPAWRSGRDWRTLPVVDSLGSLGYNRLSFKWVQSEALIYHRPNQVVARQLLILTRK